MDSWLSVPCLYVLLLVAHLASGDSPAGTGRGKGDDTLNAGASSSHDENNFKTVHGPNQHDLLRLLLFASQPNRGTSNQFIGQTWGIPYRPVRRIGSEFLGKRSDIPPYYDDDGEVEKRARMGSEFLGKRGMGSEFLGKRRMGSEFLGKRGMGSEFLGKRRMGSEFLGKRGMGSEFLGKRGMGSEFLGKRGMGSEFLGKRGMGSEFLGKRGMGSEFLGKRGMGSEFLGKRRMGSEFLGKRRMGSEFLGKRRIGSEFLGKRDSSQIDADYEEFPPPFAYDDLYPQQPEFGSSLPANSNFLMEKRGSEFLKKPGNSYEYSWKRGRLGSEFLGKRSAVPEQPLPYLQTERDFDAPDNLPTSEEKM